MSVYIFVLLSSGVSSAPVPHSRPCGAGRSIPFHRLHRQRQSQRPAATPRFSDFIYTDVWYGFYDHEVPKEVYLREFYPKYQVSDEMLALTGNPQVKFMHCLPANRNEEVTDSVLDGPHSVAWDQAENRLTAQRGLLLYFGGVAEKTLNIIKAKKEEKDA